MRRFGSRWSTPLRPRGATISIDPNVRPLAIDDKAAYAARLDRFLDRAHLIKISSEDLEYLYGSTGLRGAGAQTCSSGRKCQLVVVTLAEQGSLAVTGAGFGHGGHLSVCRSPKRGPTRWAQATR